MVWGTLSREMEQGNVEVGPVMDAGLEEGYPMYVLPMQTFLEMEHWSPHQELLAAGKLKKYDESLIVCMVIRYLHYCGIN